MSTTEKLVVYYSCFNYDLETSDFSHIQDFLRTIRPQLSPNWSSRISTEFEFLNIRLSNYSLEFSCELFLCLLQHDGSVSYDSFKDAFTKELGLAQIWTAGNSHCSALDSLVFEFLTCALSLEPQQFPSRYKLLLSYQSKHELLPLVVASEEVTTIAQSISRVLRRVSYPLESLIRPETLESLNCFLASLSRRVLTTFQVTSQFATNVIEINSGLPNVCVRIIQPARDFYDKALEAWISIGPRANPVSFVNKVKEKLGNTWTEKLLLPALQFSEIAQEEWRVAADGTLDEFLRRVHERLLEVWEASIIDASKAFQEHKTVDG